MSNFDFMDKKEPMEQYAAYRNMYQYVYAAEQNYYSDHRACGENVRWALEQFCCFVSDIKSVKYKKQPTYMGAFLSHENEYLLLQAVGKVNLDHIRSINRISRTYAHTVMPGDEEKYPDMLPELFILLLWLYKTVLGLKTSLTYSSFTYEKVPKMLSPEPILEKQDTIFTSEEQVKKLRKLFPDCDTSLFYVVHKTGNAMEICDGDGNVIETYVNDQSIAQLKKKKKELKSKLDLLEMQQEDSRRKFQKELKKKEDDIAQLQKELDDARFEKKEQDGKIENLQQALLSVYDKEKEQLIEQYEQSAAETGREYEELREKYEKLLDEREAAVEMRDEIEQLIKDRKEQRKTFETEKRKLLKKIEQLQGSLGESADIAKRSGIQLTESREFINRLQTELLKKEEQLQQQETISKREYEKLNTITKKRIESFQKEQIKLATLLHNVQLENNRYKNKLKEMNSNFTQQYLQLVGNDIVRIAKGFQIYQQSWDKGKLQEYLARVKEHYESVIKTLEEQIRKQQEELREKREEQRRWEERQREERKKRYVQSSDKERKKAENTYKKIAMAFFSGMALAAILIFVIFNKRETKEEFAEEESMEEEFTEEYKIEKQTEQDTEQDFSGQPETDMELNENIEAPEQMEQEDYFEEEEEEEEIEEIEFQSVTKLEDIPGISESFLEQFAEFTSDLEAFCELADWGKEDEKYHILGDYMIPYLMPERSFFSRTLYSIEGADKIKYVYRRFTPGFVPFPHISYAAAIAPETLSSFISYESSLADVVEQLGIEDVVSTNYDRSIYGGEEEGTLGMVVRFALEDEHQLFFFFDIEGEKMLDNVYVMDQLGIYGL